MGAPKHPLVAVFQRGFGCFRLIRILLASIAGQRCTLPVRIPEPSGQVQVGAPNPLAWVVTSLSNCPVPSNLPRTVGESHWPQCSGCPWTLPATLNVMGLGTGLSSWYVPHDMKTPGVPHFTYLQPWTFSVSGSPITNGSPIADNHCWWNDSTFQSHPQGEPWLLMPVCGCLALLPGPLHTTPPLDSWSGHRWHGTLCWNLDWGVQPGSASGSSSWLLLWLGVFPTMPEALLNCVEDLLMDILCHLYIAWVHARCPL